MGKNFGYWAFQIYQNQSFISSLLSRKTTILFAIFGLFWPGDRVGSQIKGLESKFDNIFVHLLKYFAYNIFLGTMPTFLKNNELIT